VTGLVDDIARPPGPVQRSDQRGQGVQDVNPWHRAGAGDLPSNPRRTQARCCPLGRTRAPLHLELAPHVNSPGLVTTGFFFHALNTQRDFADEFPPHIHTAQPVLQGIAQRSSGCAWREKLALLECPRATGASVEDCLGVPMGSITGPVAEHGRSAKRATYDPESRSEPDARRNLIQLGDVGRPAVWKGDHHWQQLLLK